MLRLHTTRTGHRNALPCSRIGVAAGLLAAAVLLAGAAPARATGFGEDIREVPAFTAISVGSALHVTVTMGNTRLVRLGGEPALVKLVRTEVRDGKLLITMARTRKLDDVRERIAIHVTTPALDAAEASGAAELEVAGARTSQLTVGASGAARIIVRGVAERVRITASGAANVDTREVPAREAAIKASGAANVLAHAGQVAIVEASSAANVVVAGNPPRVERRVSGAANVTLR